MSKLTRLSPEDRSELVAYLDGELDDQTTQRIEAVLGQSPVARNDVEMLVRTYDLLDLLPRPKATTEFTEKTIATARLAEAPVDFTRTEGFQKARQFARVLAASAVVAACGLGGYAAVNQFAPLPSDLLLRDLPVIEKVDEYTEVGDIEFLKRLGNESSLMRDIQAEVSRDRK